MSVERRLVGPTFQQNQFVRVERTLENLELLATGFLHALLATRPVRLRELGSFSRCGRNRDDKPNCHNPSYSWMIENCLRRSSSTIAVPPRQGSALGSGRSLVFKVMFRFNSVNRTAARLTT
jgi:hypothetical protein